MAKKRSQKKVATVNQRLAAIERLVRAGSVDTKLGFQQTNRRIDAVNLDLREFRKEVNQRFAEVEDRIDRLATHVDGFMKLHETLDIEMRVMKEQMNRMEERLTRLEAGRAT